jgi:hypothetical protein
MHAEGTEDDKSIRADVGIYIKNRLMLTVEVKHTHRTDPVSRGDVPFVEVDAEHVIRTVTTSLDTTDVIVLKCEATNKKKVCTEYCAYYNTLYEYYVEELYECSNPDRRSCSGAVPFKGKALCALCKFGTINGSHSHCYVCSMALKDENGGTNRAEALLSERWEKMKRWGLVYVPDNDGEDMWVKGLDGECIVRVN